MRKHASGVPLSPATASAGPYRTRVEGWKTSAKLCSKAMTKLSTTLVTLFIVLGRFK